MVLGYFYGLVNLDLNLDFGLTEFVVGVFVWWLILLLCFLL